MSNSHTNAQPNQRTPKILYVEDQLAQNIPRLLRLFENHLGPQELERLQELESDLTGYGASPEEIKQIFKSLEFVDIEYRFPDALARILHDPESYTLFLVDRNLSEAGYTVEEVQKIDSEYSQELHDLFHEREGDYLLLVLLLANRNIDVSEKFYFLTAYPPQTDEIRNVQKVEALVNIDTFKQHNFIEKGNTQDVQRLCHVIEATPLHSQQNYAQIRSSLATPEYLFTLRDGGELRGTFVSPGLRIQTKNGKLSLNTSQIRKITRSGHIQSAEFRVTLETSDTYQGRILDKKIIIETQTDPKHQIISQNIDSVELVQDTFQG